MEYLILIGVLIVIALPITIILRKAAYKRINGETDNFLKKRGSSLEQELQNFINLQNPNVKVTLASVQNTFKYYYNQFICMTVKFKVEGNSDSYLGIVSDSGSYTEFQKYNVLTFFKDQYVLLKKIYNRPNREVNVECFPYLSKLDNVYNFNISPEEKIIFNSIATDVIADDNRPIGFNVFVTVTDKSLYINNELGIWTFDLYSDIADYRLIDNHIDIDLTEICIFGTDGERFCTGFKFFFNDNELKRFENLLENIIM